VPVKCWFHEAHPCLVRVNAGSTYRRVVVRKNLPTYRAPFEVRTLVADVLPQPKVLLGQIKKREVGRGLWDQDDLMLTFFKWD
jgi:hypothetical protein